MLNIECFKIQNHEIINPLAKKKASQYKLKGLINMAATYSPTLLCSTIGHEGLNCSVRYGKR